MKTVLLALLASAAVLATTPVAMANSVDIGFSCADGNGTLTGRFAGEYHDPFSSTSACTSGKPTYAGPETFANWTQGGFTVNFSSSVGEEWLFNPNQGDPKPGATGLSLAAHSSAFLTVGDAGKTFIFDGLNIGGTSSSGVLTYDIKGFLKGVQVFNLTGFLCSSARGSLGACANVKGQAKYYFINGNYVHIDSLEIDVSNSKSGSFSSAYLDNIALTETPEPGSLAVLGFCLLVLGMMVRRMRA